MGTLLRVALIAVTVGLLMAGPPVYAESRQTSTSQVWTGEDNAVVPGVRSKLIRRDHAVCMRMHTRDLPKGAYTIWWSIFNNPEHCTSPGAIGDARCGGDDFANKAVHASFLWVGGGLVGPDGVGYFNTCLAENTLPGEVFDGPGLTDAQGAEIHIILRSHCEAEYGRPRRLGLQLSLFGGGCTVASGGEEGRGTCECTNPQFTIHPAP